MYQLRGCPKCHGDLYAGQDIYGAYLSCVQCGRYYAVGEAADRSEYEEASAPAVGPPAVADLKLAA